MEEELRFYPFTKVTHPSTTLIIGPPRSGKTTTVLNIIKPKIQFYRVLYQHSLDIETIHSFIEDVKEVKQVFSACIILEDPYIPEKASESLLNLLNICRHSSISVIITTSRINEIPFNILALYSDFIISITDHRVLRPDINRRRQFGQLFKPFFKSSESPMSAFDQLCRSSKTLVVNNKIGKLFCENDIPKVDVDWEIKELSNPDLIRQKFMKNYAKAVGKEMQIKMSFEEFCRLVGPYIKAQKNTQKNLF